MGGGSRGGGWNGEKRGWVIVIEKDACVGNKRPLMSEVYVGSFMETQIQLHSYEGRE